jgi:hypothetical protein
MGLTDPRQGARPSAKKDVAPRPCLRCDKLFNTTIFFRICASCTTLNQAYAPMAAEAYSTNKQNKTRRGAE